MFASQWLRDGNIFGFSFVTTSTLVLPRSIEKYLVYEYFRGVGNFKAMLQSFQAITYVI